jgi:hypothetical protein
VTLEAVLPFGPAQSEEAVDLPALGVPAVAAEETLRPQDAQVAAEVQEAERALQRPEVPAAASQEGPPEAQRVEAASR